ncbi:putative cytochrome P450 12a5, mitochondrial [Eufriesea mexicana]|uniref:Putative cytochrome P450 12a5, mitochondrial n=1 Tax=Eufriesea mexicana TaxID=516756 RepID=A0A310SH17_9HYME|nr:putative cytochrome P450 12a5, mitochondrial [Eufriesea mexicana]
MQRLLPNLMSISRQYSVMKISKPLGATDGQKCLDTAASSVSQSRAASLINESLRAEAIPLLDQSATEVSPAAFEVSTMKIDTQIVGDKSPLPFEEVPGPAILKIWEKYWKYVPLLGTQLLSSLLINRFTQGRLTWNRNITPLKYLFNEYGCIVRINGPLSGDIVMIHRPEHITEVFKQEGDTPVPSSFHEDMIRWAMDCFCDLTFNKRLGFLESAGYNSTSEPTRIINALTTAHKYMSRCETGFQVWRFFLTPFAKKLFDACDVLNNVIARHVRQAQNKLRVRKTHADKSLTTDDTFLLYYLAKNPRTQRRLYDEITSVLPNNDSPFTEKALRNMPFLKACLQETLRLHPAVPYITRLLPKTICLHGYTIPKGTFVIMANQITSQREENFEDPMKFRPERWLSNCAKENIDFSYLPFGYGARSCLGKHMAETKMMLLTAKLIRQFRIEYDYADIKSTFMMVNVPNKPLRFRFVNRN